MDNDDSGPRHLLIFTLAVLVLLVQLDVLANTVCNSGNTSLAINYCIAEDEVQNIETPEEFYSGFRFAVPASPHFVLNSSKLTPTKVLSGYIPGLLKGVPKNNRPTHRMCCVYLL